MSGQKQFSSSCSSLSSSSSLFTREFLVFHFSISSLCLLYAHCHIAIYMSIPYESNSVRWSVSHHYYYHCLYHHHHHHRHLPVNSFIEFQMAYESLINANNVYMGRWTAGIFVTEATAIHCIRCEIVEC